MANYINLAPCATVIFVLTIGLSLICLFVNKNLLDVLILKPNEVFKNGKFYTLITSGFIHADLSHLFFNMFTFYFFAFKLEMVVGHWQFLVIYLVSLIVSDLPSVFKHSDDGSYRSLGASGAISAVLFSYVLYYPFSSLYMMFIPIPIPAILFAVLYLGYCVWASKKQYDNVNHSAHFWGAVSGIALTALIDQNSIVNFLGKITGFFNI